MASTTCGRRMFLSLKSYLIGRHLPPGTSRYIRVGRASCSTTADTSNTSPISGEAKNDALSSSQVEHVLMEMREKDMPIDMSNPYEREKIRCILCKYNIRLDYKNVRLLSQFISPYTGKVYGRNITRLCRKQQGELEKEVQKSIAAGYIAVMLKDVGFLKDPKLFDPNNPVRPHNY
ncbi:28S ribosomal protein S18c, mitochondrial-like [Homarus americanus]|uniref:28S ribosomal protein S18c-like n=1 Tax=Homarus americanus TaxID=6706 RepID=A0A8J5K787_HOMAM|nr:28S ribosomal protein S18c, mitochondrial-like [Homarus americanus]KAG7168971.1 28S ribosomal protein S18c-like [Homarus americanus]